jgi:hypothetical protein
MRPNEYFGIREDAGPQATADAVERKKIEINQAIAAGKVRAIDATVELRRQIAAITLKFGELPPPTPAAPPKPPVEQKPVAVAEPKPATTNCVACKGVVSLAAKLCPHCGHEGPAVLRAKEEAAKVQSQANSGCLIVIVAIIGILIAGSFIGGSGSSTSSGSSASNSISAMADCKRQVTARLKSPSSAQFENVDEYGDTATNTVREIRGVVSSVNSFGVRLNSNFTCSVIGAQVTSAVVY